MPATDHRDVESTITRAMCTVTCACGQVFRGATHFQALTRQMQHRQEAKNREQ